MGELREPRPGVPEPLDRDPDVFPRPSPGTGDAIQSEQGSAAGRRVAAHRMIVANRMAGETGQQLKHLFVQLDDAQPGFI